LKLPRKLPPHCERWNDRHGKLRIYFRLKGGKRVALPVTVGSAEFDAAYKAALIGEVLTDVPLPRLAPPAAGTFGALIISYQGSAAFADLKPSSKAGYYSRMEIIRAAHSHRTVIGLTRANIVEKVLGPYADRPGQRLAVLKMLRVLIRHAIESGLLKNDPSLGIKKPKSNEIRSWTDKEIYQFERRWSVSTKQRLAFALHLYTGQRRSDIHRMAWDDIVAEARIRVVQQKTGQKVDIPLHTALKEVLAVAHRGQRTILATEYGKPFTVDGFSQFMRSAIIEAGLPLDCQPHGLRKAAGRRLAEAGCSAREIMSVLGHRTLAEAERYTRDADNALLATAAMARLEGAESQTPLHRFGKADENRFDIKAPVEGLALPRGLEPLFSP